MSPMRSPLSLRRCVVLLAAPLIIAATFTVDRLTAVAGAPVNRDRKADVATIKEIAPKLSVRFAKKAGNTAKLANRSGDVYLRVLQAKAFSLDAGSSGVIMGLGGVAHRAECSDVGGGQTRIDITASSSTPGAFLFGPNGSVELTGTPVLVWSAQSAGQAGFSVQHDVELPSGKAPFQHYLTVFGVHTFGKDCIVRMTATRA